MKNNEAKAIVVFLQFFLCILYVCLFLNVPSSILRDRDAYSSIARDATQYIQLFGFDLFLHEPIFLYFNVILMNFFSSNMIPYIFVFIITSCIVLTLQKVAVNFLFFIMGLFAFTFTPGMFHLQLVTLRQGLASALFLLLIVFLKDEKKLLAGLFLLSFVHASFILFFCIYALYYIVSNNFKNRLYSNLFVSILISVGLLFGSVIGSYIGIYQFSYMDTEVSGFLGFFLYLFCSIYLIFFCKDSFKGSKLYDLSLIFMLIGVFSFFTVPFLGRYSITFFLFLFILLVQKRGGVNFIFMSVLILLFAYKFYSGAIVDLSLLVNDLSLLGLPWVI